jgi:hypothetical protein
MRQAVHGADSHLVVVVAAANRPFVRPRALVRTSHTRANDSHSTRSAERGRGLSYGREHQSTPINLTDMSAHIVGLQSPLALVQRGPSNSSDPAKRQHQLEQGGLLSSAVAGTAQS